MKHPFVAAVTAVVSSLAVANAQTVPADIERFKLWYDCSPIELLVEGLHDDATRIDLTNDRIETLVRSRLRAARIYTDTIEPLGAYLYVNINVLGSSFGIMIQFKKYVTDWATNDTGFATIWETGAVGTHGQNAGFILQTLSEYVDEFIDEYLRVNEEAC